jgi:hypothetical protein
MNTSTLQDTSLITILSSTHGRIRREQRSIDKRDLQKAMKYGTCLKNWKGRWKFEYDGITFITDPSKRQEITAFPSPLPDVRIDIKTKSDHSNLKELLNRKPKLSTSHTVFVIDNSGSMLSKRNDIHLYRDSQDAAFSLTALEFVAEQILNKTAVNSDLVSLIKFSEHPQIALEREPIDWITYNEILSHRNREKFEKRMEAPEMDDRLGHSNFIPALEDAHRLLKQGQHDHCALSIFFFSDGLSTDYIQKGISYDESINMMKNIISKMASEFGDRLTFNTVGRGDKCGEFESLKGMADAATCAGARGSFERCDKTAHSISSAISSLVTATSETMVALREGKQRTYTQRVDLISETDANVKTKWKFFEIHEHYIYNPTRKTFVKADSFVPLSACREGENSRLCTEIKYLAVNSNYLGKGAERVTFRCRLSRSAKRRGFVLGELVAKETKDIERLEEKEKFHKGECLDSFMFVHAILNSMCLR